MAYEVKDWKEAGCSLFIKPSNLSSRETFSKEINETFGEGGGLNADYRTVEAVAIVANVLALNGLIYGIDFIFKTGGADKINFDFCNKSAKKSAKEILASVEMLKY